MLTKKITTKKETTLKEKITSEITLLLTSAFATLKDGLGEKKFEKRKKQQNYCRQALRLQAG